MNCYGKHYGKLPSCNTCEMSDYCRDAKDPPVLTYNELSDDIEQATVSPGDTSYESDSIEFFRCAIRRLIDATGGDLTMLGIVMARCSGMTYQGIADRYGITRQAVHKKIIGLANKDLASLLKCRPNGDSVTKEELSQTDFLTEMNENIRRLKWQLRRKK